MRRLPILPATLLALGLAAPAAAVTFPFEVSSTFTASATTQDFSVPLNANRSYFARIEQLPGAPYGFNPITLSAADSRGQTLTATSTTLISSFPAMVVTTDAPETVTFHAQSNACAACLGHPQGFLLHVDERPAGPVSVVVLKPGHNAWVIRHPADADDPEAAGSYIDYGIMRDFDIDSPITVTWKLVPLGGGTLAEWQPSSRQGSVTFKPGEFFKNVTLTLAGNNAAHGTARYRLELASPDKQVFIPRATGADDSLSGVATFCVNDTLASAPPCGKAE